MGNPWQKIYSPGWKFNGAPSRSAMAKGDMLIRPQCRRSAGLRILQADLTHISGRMYRNYCNLHIDMPDLTARSSCAQNFSFPGLACLLRELVRAVFGSNYANGWAGKGRNSE